MKEKQIQISQVKIVEGTPGYGEQNTDNRIGSYTWELKEVPMLVLRFCLINAQPQNELHEELRECWPSSYSTILEAFEEGFENESGFEIFEILLHHEYEDNGISKSLIDAKVPYLIQYRYKKEDKLIEIIVPSNIIIAALNWELQLGGDHMKMIERGNELFGKGNWIHDWYCTPGNIFAHLRENKDLNEEGEEALREWEPFDDLMIYDWYARPKEGQQE